MSRNLRLVGMVFLEILIAIICGFSWVWYSIFSELLHKPMPYNLPVFFATALFLTWRGFLLWQRNPFPPRGKNPFGFALSSFLAGGGVHTLIMEKQHPVVVAFLAAGTIVAAIFFLVWWIDGIADRLREEFSYA